MDFAAGAAASLDVLRFVHISSWVKCRESLRRAQFAHGQKSVQGLPLSGRFALAPFVWPCEVRVRISLRLRSRLERDRCSQLEPFWRVRVFFRWAKQRSSRVARKTPTEQIPNFGHWATKHPGGRSGERKLRTRQMAQATSDTRARALSVVWEEAHMYLARQAEGASAERATQHESA